MEISRSPLAPAGRPAAYTGTAPRTAVIEPAAPEASRPRVRSGEQVERVVQGELLQRERSVYQSTRAYVNERRFDAALQNSAEGGRAPRGRTAISQYLNNTRPETVAELAHGQSINYFI